MEKAEHLKIEPTFYDRADAHIHLSNSQLSDINPGKVSASMTINHGQGPRFNDVLSFAALPLYLRCNCVFQQHWHALCARTCASPVSRKILLRLCRRPPVDLV